MVYVDVKHHVYLLTYWDRHIYYVTRTRRRFDSTTTLGSMERRRCTGNDRTIPDLSIESTKTLALAAAAAAAAARA